MSSLYPNPTSLELSHARFDGRVTVRREYTYPRPEAASGGAAFGCENRFAEGRTSLFNKHKDRPDIALEFLAPGKTVPDIVVFDATIARLNARERDFVYEKFRYYDSIRSFNDDDRDETGESRRIVKASWAIIPGDEKASWAIVPGKEINESVYKQLMPNADRAEVRWRWGIYRLNATEPSIRGLTIWLDNLLTGVGLLPPKRDEESRTPGVKS